MAKKRTRLLALLLSMFMMTSAGVDVGVGGSLSLTANATAVTEQSEAVEGATEMLLYNEKGYNVSTVKNWSCYNCETGKELQYTESESWEDASGRMCYYSAIYRDVTVKLNKADELVVAVDSAYTKQITEADTSFSKFNQSFAPQITKVTDTKYVVRFFVSMTYISFKNDTATTRTVVDKCLKAGKYAVTLTTKSGIAYRTFNLDVKAPTQKANVKLNGTAISPEGTVVIANRKQQITVDKDSASVDKFNYTVTDVNGQPTDLAKVTADGEFTPLKNGVVLVTVTPADGETRWKREWVTKRTGDQYAFEEMGTVAITNSKGETEYKAVKGKFLQYTQILPYQFKVYIVRANPAKALTITNAPAKMELNSSVALTLEKTPTYNGSEYSTSATDIIKWESSDEKVLKVTADGVVTAVGGGTAKIRATGDISSVYAEVEITVDIPLKSLRFTEATYNVPVGAKKEVVVQRTPENSTEAIILKTSNKNIVAVSKADGHYYIKGVAEGTAVITIMSRVNEKVLGTATVVVQKKVSGTALNVIVDGTKTQNGGTVTLDVGKTAQIEPRITMSDGTYNKDVMCEVVEGADCVSLASNSKGYQIKGILRGTALLQFTSEQTDGVAYLYVKVTRGASTLTLTESSNPDKTITKLTTFVGKTVTVTPDLRAKGNLPYDHDDEIVSIESSNPAVVSVGEDNTLTAQSVGVATILYKANSGLTAKLTVTVTDIAQVVITNSNIVMQDGVPTLSVELSQKTRTVKLGCQVYSSSGSSLSNMPIEWTSSNPEIATVNGGLIQLLTRGTVQITAKVGKVSDTIILHSNVDIDTATFEAIPDMEYNPALTEMKPVLNVSYAGVVLKEGVDYTAEYSGNTGVGKGKIKVTGIGDFAGTSIISFNIVKVDISKVSISGVKAQSWTGSYVSVVPVLKYNGVQLVESVDYTYTCSDNLGVGTATLKITGKGNYTGVITKTYSINATEISKAEITLSQTTYKYTGKECKPTVTVLLGTKKVSADNYKVTYENNINAGTATVIITGRGGLKGSVRKSFTITSDAPTAVKLSPTAITLGVGETFDLKATYTPTNVKETTLTWKSSSESVVSVDNGTLKAKAVGKATITVTAVNGVKATCTVTVLQAPTTITASSTNIVMGLGEKVVVTTGVNTGAGANYRTYTIDKNGNDILTFYQTNVWRFEITGKKEGTTNITAKTYNGKMVVIKVTVKKAPTKVEIRDKNVTVGVGETYTLRTVLPNGEASFAKTYATNNSNVTLNATVGGRFVGNIVGTSVITVTTFNGQKASVTVTVKSAPSKIRIYSTSEAQKKIYTTDPNWKCLTSLTVKQGSYFTLCSAVDDGAWCNTKQWTIDNTNVVRMTDGSQNRGFYAGAKGTAKVTVTTYNGKTATCTINVV